MIKKLTILILISCCVSCHKNSNQPACGTQTCTLSYATIGVAFADKNGAAVTVKNYSAVNQRTHEKLMPPGYYDTVPGYYIVANDSMRDQFSTEGDEVLITATHPTTNQTKTVTFKISGGCNCHVDKVSGVSPVVFD